MNILVVETETSVSQMLVDVVADPDISLLTATDGATAWDLFCHTKTPIDLVIAEQQLSRMTGLELLRSIKDDFPHTQVALVMDEPTVAQCKEAFKHGACDLLSKPLEAGALDLLVHRARQYSSENDELIGALNYTQEWIRMEIPSQIRLISRVVSHLRSRCQLLLEKHLISTHQFSLCLYESLSNAIIHGNLGIPSSVRKEDGTYQEYIEQHQMVDELVRKTVTVHCHLTADEITVHIEDQGNGFDTTKLPDPNDPQQLLSNSGRGLFIIQIFMSQVSWNPKGNAVTMTKVFK